MRENNDKTTLILRILISCLFLLSAFAKLYPTPMQGITKIFEQGQLVPMGFSEGLVPYLSRFIIGLELFLAISILFSNYLRRIIVPIAFIMVTIFSIHLSTEVFGDLENCGCFGELIPMTPLEALVKNILTLVVLAFIYKRSDDNVQSFSRLVILFLTILMMMFAFLPISSQSKSIDSSFISHVEDDDFINLEGKKLLCFFDPYCDHCQKAAKKLDSLSTIMDDFPQSYIIFQNLPGDTIVSETMQNKINDFFVFAGNKFPYQVMLHDKYETEEIDSYLEIIYPIYDNPVVILYDGKLDYDVVVNRQIRLYEGDRNNFNANDLRRILEIKK